jgi:hypothetical protein
MTRATRQALENISRLLHEAGWDAPPEPAREISDQTIEAMRRVYDRLDLREHLGLIQDVLANKMKVEDAARTRGVGEQAAKRLFVEAMLRLHDFTEQAEAQGLCAPAAGGPRTDVPATL